MAPMGTSNTLLCIHRDPAHLSLLRENGYELVTATNSPDGLRLFMSRPVDAVVLDHGLGLLNIAVVAAEMKKINPQIPIVVLADGAKLPDDALKSVDALVYTSDGSHFLWATVHFILNVRPAQHPEGKLRDQRAERLHRPGRSQEGWNGSRPIPLKLANDEKDLPFSARVWQGIRNGTVQF
jgi:CheY-like chemotaxis protein